MSLTPQEQERLHYIHGGAEAEAWRLMCVVLEEKRELERELPACNQPTYAELEAQIEELTEERDILKDRVLACENELHDYATGAKKP